MAYVLSYMAISFLVQNALFSRVPLAPDLGNLRDRAGPLPGQGDLPDGAAAARRAKFNVTAKDETLAEDYISPIYKPLTVTCRSLMRPGSWRWSVRWIAFPGDRGVLAVVGGWAIFNFLLCR